MFGQWFLVRGPVGLEPAFGPEAFGVGVQCGVAGEGEVDGVDDGALGEEVAVVFVIFFEEAGDTFWTLLVYG